MLKKETPDIGNEEDVPATVQPPTRDLPVIKRKAESAPTDNPRNEPAPVSDITAERERHQMERETADAKHKAEHNDKITKYGFFLVAGILIGCFLMASISACFGDTSLFQKFMEISATAVTLVLGYLFGSKDK